MTPAERSPGGNGHVPDADLDAGEGPDDDSPLDEAEAAAAAATADAPADESLDERIERVVEDLGGVERRRASDGIAYAVGGRVFAILGDERVEVALDPAVSKAALRTPDTAASPRGAGWIGFTPSTIDRFALDRAEAWLRSAHSRTAR